MSPLPTLRDYQQQAIHSLDAHRTEGAPRVLAVMATGLGKTATASSYARHLGARTLWLAHREELLDQAAEAFHRWWPETTTGIIAANRNDYNANVVIASVQTLRQPRRLASIAQHHFDLVIIDETHHVRYDPAKPDVKCAYRTIIDGIAGTSLLDQPFVVGLTATPDRLDRKSVVDWFDQRIAVNLDIAWAIEHGHLVDIRATRVEVGLDLDQVKTRGGDYVDGDLGRALTDASAPQQMVQAWLERGENRITMAFTPTVATSRELATEFGKAGVRAAHVDGGTPKEDRRRLFDDLRAGRVQVLCNVGVATEGFDAPIVSCVLMCRPTKSRGLYAQMLGRGLRLSPGKTDCLVIDLAGATNKSSLVLAHDLLGLHKALEQHETAKARMAGDAATAAKEEADKAEQAELELQDSWVNGHLRFKDVDAVGRPKGQKHEWVHTPIDGCHDRWVHTIPGVGKVIVKRGRNPEARSWVAGVHADDGTATVLFEGLITRALQHAETWIDVARKENAWMLDPPSVKQLAYLESLGVDHTRIPRMTKKMAGALIDQATRGAEQKRRKQQEAESRSALVLERVTPENVVSAAGRRAMIRVEDMDSMLGVTVPSEWSDQFTARARATCDVLVDRGVLRRQGAAYVVIGAAS